MEKTSFKKGDTIIHPYFSIGDKPTTKSWKSTVTSVQKRHDTTYVYALDNETKEKYKINIDDINKKGFFTDVIPMLEYIIKGCERSIREYFELNEYDYDCEDWIMIMDDWDFDKELLDLATKRLKAEKTKRSKNS